MHTASSLTERTISEIRAEFPSFRIIAKRDDALSKAIDVTLRILTFGGQRFYLTHYHTVLGYRLYVPDVWERLGDVDRAIVLRHERVHLRQRRRYGMALMTFLYLIPILPLGLAYGRARIEWEAYTETLRATAELAGLDQARSPALRRSIIERFTGSAYGWMWPFPRQVGAWYDAVLRAIEHNYSGA